MNVKYKIAIYTKDTPFGVGFTNYFQKTAFQIEKLSNIDCVPSSPYDLVLIDAESQENWWSLDLKKKGGQVVMLSSSSIRYHNVIVLNKSLSANRLKEELSDILLKVKSPDNSMTQNITKREFEILECLSEGQTTKQIAELCKVSVATINAHRSSLINKYGAKNTANLVYTYLKKLREVG